MHSEGTDLSCILSNHSLLINVSDKQTDGRTDVVLVAGLSASTQHAALKYIKQRRVDSSAVSVYVEHEVIRSTVVSLTTRFCRTSASRRRPAYGALRRS